MSGWIGVDLDGTLATYDGWKGVEHIGDPIPVMLDRVKRWLDEGQDVRILTARASGPPMEAASAIFYIHQWCLKHLGRLLPITNAKDYHMIEVWDDRAVQVIPNTGERADGRTDSERVPLW